MSINALVNALYFQLWKTIIIYRMLQRVMEQKNTKAPFCSFSSSYTPIHEETGSLRYITYPQIFVYLCAIYMSLCQRKEQNQREVSCSYRFHSNLSSWRLPLNVIIYVGLLFSETNGRECLKPVQYIFFIEHLRNIS